MGVHITHEPFMPLSSFGNIYRGIWIYKQESRAHPRCWDLVLRFMPISYLLAKQPDPHLEEQHLSLAVWCK